MVRALHDELHHKCWPAILHQELPQWKDHQAWWLAPSVVRPHNKQCSRCLKLPPLSDLPARKGSMKSSCVLSLPILILSCLAFTGLDQAAEPEIERIFGPEVKTGPYKHPACMTELGN